MGAFGSDASIPLDQLGGAKVVAVTGDNGVGKTTALELIPGAFYLTTPSRGQLSGLAHRRDSFVETAIQVGEDELIARVMVNGHHRQKKTEAYLIDGATNEPITDGKVRSFKEAISDRLPSSATYLASAFAAQGGGGRFLDLQPAKRKELFASLLGLGYLEVLSAAAGERARATETEVAKLRGKTEALTADAALFEQRSEDLHTAEQRLAIARDDRDLVEQQEKDAALALERWREDLASLTADLDRAKAAARAALDERNAISEAMRDAYDAASEQTAAETEARISKAALDAGEREQRECAAARDAWRAELDQLLNAQRDAESALDKADRREAQMVADLDRMRVRMGDLRARAARLDDAQAKRRDLEERVRLAELAEDELQRLESDLRAIHDQEVSNEREINAWREECARAASDLALAEQKAKAIVSAAAGRVDDAREALDRAQSESGLLFGLPCAGDGDYAGCQLIASAVSARDSIPGLEGAAEQARQAWEDADDALRNGLDEQREALAEAQQREPDHPVVASTSAIEDQITEVKITISEGANARVDLVEVDLSESHAREAIAEIETLEPELLAGTDACDLASTETEAAQTAYENVRRDVQTHRGKEPLVVSGDEIQRLRNRHRTAADAAARAGARHEAAIAKLEEVGDDLDGAEHAVSEATAAEHGARRALDEHGRAKPESPDDAELARYRDAEREQIAAVVRAQEALAASEIAVEQVAAIGVELRDALADLDDWRHLQKALGRNGIQALEIDAAGPEASELTNDLLHACYGPRFTVALETTALRADGKGTKEVFDLRTIDTERGTDGSADQLSGGEQVLVSEAMSLAICVYNARRSGIPMADLFRDECAGALSSGNAERYVAMLRRALDLGGFHRVYFVAHQPHLWDLADARLVVADGAIRVA
jgi:exonuclease SbcC